MKNSQLKNKAALSKAFKELKLAEAGKLRAKPAAILLKELCNERVKVKI